MKTQFLDSNIPHNYCLLPKQNLEINHLKKIRKHQGRDYVLLGTAEKKLQPRDRVWLGVHLFAKIILSFGLIFIFNEKNREDWTFFWRGKRSCVLYGSTFLSKKILEEQGNGKALYEIGFIYEHGEEEGVEQSYKEALLYYRSAAKKNDPIAQYQLGEMYEYGDDGIEQSYQKAFHYYKLAAKQGIPEAEYKLGSIYKHGLGVKRSLDKAIKYYKSAAKKNNLEAQCQLGEIYKHAQSYKKAAHYFELAAKQGDSVAQSELGEIYKDGLGGVKSIELAIYYFKLAAKQGDPVAQQQLKSI